MCMSAAGLYLPPMLIWPRKHLPDAFMLGAPPGSIGAVSDNERTKGACQVSKITSAMHSATVTIACA